MPVCDIFHNRTYVLPAPEFMFYCPPILERLFRTNVFMYQGRGGVGRGSPFERGVHQIFQIIFGIVKGRPELPILVLAVYVRLFIGHLMQIRRYKV